MSLIPLNNNNKMHHHDYNSISNDSNNHSNKDETDPLIVVVMKEPISQQHQKQEQKQQNIILHNNDHDNDEMKQFIYTICNQQTNLFEGSSYLAISLWYKQQQQSKTGPRMPPCKRGKRHRNYYIYQLNQFRHWWKTSRLLVRVAGGIAFYQIINNWELMSSLNVIYIRQLKLGAKISKRIGQGGPIKDWLNEVQPYTRLIRIILAVARATEANVDNRMFEVGIAEAFAFIGNRCSRYWLRNMVDWTTLHIALPFSSFAIAPYLEQNSRPVIITMGFLRAILPFMASFQGSRIGRQLTFNTFKYANYRWEPVQSIMHFHESTGTYQDTCKDPELLAFARMIAEMIGNGKDSSTVRCNLASIGLDVFGSGCGGHTAYRMIKDDKCIMLHLTPYGPSILGELPFYLLLERRSLSYKDSATDIVYANMLDAATPCEAKLRGFTYSGAYFQIQEWAALKNRFDCELECYSNACSLMGTIFGKKKDPYKMKVAFPPNDLRSLKAFIRSGRPIWKQRKDDYKFSAIHKQIQRMATLLTKYQKTGKSPARVILYLEGLDCSGKSSTGMLISDALQQCGYDVTVAQHNRPPTDEQKKHGWMNRIRFEYPDDMYRKDEPKPQYAAVVWDRGPVGDFVYGSFNGLPIDEKLKHYREFREYDYQCKNNNVLFCKVFFVTDKDSIAATLGKRLAHKHIVEDLKSWLDANSVQHFRDGLDGIEHHIDPTDFIAFNRYEINIKKFSEVVRNTDYANHIGSTTNDPDDIYINPWLVVNTSNRHQARLHILKAFGKQIQRHANARSLSYDTLVRFWCLRSACGGRNDIVFDIDEENRPVPNDIVEEREHGISLRAVFQSLILAFLLYVYAQKTWDISFDDVS